MKRITIIITLALGLLLLCAASALCEDLLGQPFPDFTVTTTDGDTFTLSEALQEKDMVFINLFATWCGPCKREFPAMQAAYEACADRVAVIVLGADESETLEELAAYKAENGLIMPFACEAGTGINDFVGLEGYPTSVAVDRFGNISMVEVGAVTDASRFKALFQALTADDYSETVAFDEMPEAAMDVEYPDATALNAALNAEGSALAFTCDPDGALYPFLPAEADGRQAVTASNIDRSESDARVETTLTAQAGDALAFDFACQANAGYDFLTVEIDGETAKAFTGAHDWTTWALPLTEGAHTVAFTYSIFEAADQFAMLDDVRVRSGDDAAAALAALPEYPTAECFGLRVTNDGARLGHLTLSGDDAGEYFWVVGGDTAHVEVDLTADMDPEAAALYDYINGEVYIVATLRTDDGSAYALDLPIDEVGALMYYANLFDEDCEYGEVYLFPDESPIQLLLDYYTEGDDGTALDWEYVDEMP